MKESSEGRRDKTFALFLLLLGAGLAVAHAGLEALPQFGDGRLGFHHSD
jgi:hypothetical protein